MLRLNLQQLSIQTDRAYSPRHGHQHQRTTTSIQMTPRTTTSSQHNNTNVIKLKQEVSQKYIYQNQELQNKIKTLLQENQKLRLFCKPVKIIQSPEPTTKRTAFRQSRNQNNRMSFDGFDSQRTLGSLKEEIHSMLAEIEIRTSKSKAKNHPTFCLSKVPRRFQTLNDQ